MDDKLQKWADLAVYGNAAGDLDVELPEEIDKEIAVKLSDKAVELFPDAETLAEIVKSRLISLYMELKEEVE